MIHYRKINSMKEYIVRTASKGLAVSSYLVAQKGLKQSAECRFFDWMITRQWVLHNRRKFYASFVSKLVHVITSNAILENRFWCLKMPRKKKPLVRDNAFFRSCVAKLMSFNWVLQFERMLKSHQDRHKISLEISLIIFRLLLLR